jgi:hypothetical protein
MCVRKILPDIDAGRTYLRPRVARFSRNIKVIVHLAVRTAIRRASQRGVISLTITA